MRKVLSCFATQGCNELKVNLLLATFAVLLMTESSAFAMTFVDADEVMGASFGWPSWHDYLGTTLTVTDLDGTELVFTIHDGESWRTNYVTMESFDGETVYSTFPAGMRFSVKEIRTEDPERKFWLARTGVGVSDDACKSFRLIGRDGDTYVEYLTLEDLQEAGLSGYEVYWRVEDGEIVVAGWVRNRGRELAFTGKMDSKVDEVRLFWDEDADGIGIRRNPPRLYETDTWFYTDEEGANYYLRWPNRTQSLVVKVEDDGEISYLVYKFEDAPQCSYFIYDSGSFEPLGPEIESGSLSDGSDANPSAVALYKGYSDAMKRRK